MEKQLLYWFGLYLRLLWWLCCLPVYIILWSYRGYRWLRGAWIVATHDALPCPGCRRGVSLVGRFQCSCGYTFDGFAFTRCPICQDVPPYIACQHPWRYVTPIRFTRITRKGYARVQTKSWYHRRVKSITCGSVTPSDKPLRVFHNAHELGHVLETTVEQSKSKAAFADLRAELQRITEQVNRSQRGMRAYKRPPLAEQFANLFALSVTQPRKAEKLAPGASQWLMKTLYANRRLRNMLSEGGFWEIDIRGVVHRKRPAQRTKVAKASPPRPPIFAGFSDVTTSVLDQLTGRRIVSKQFIADLTRSPDMRKAERHIITEALGGLQDPVPVNAFAERVKGRLLPVTPSPYSLFEARYQDYTLPEE